MPKDKKNTAKVSEEIDFYTKEKEVFELLDKVESGVIKFIEPVNSLKEQAKFFEAIQRREEYNPKFEYLSKNPIYSHFTLTPEFFELRKKIKALDVSRVIASDLLEKKKQGTIERMNFIRSIGGREFTKNSIDYFGFPDKKIVDVAYNILRKVKAEHPKKAKYSVEKAKTYFDDFLKKKKINYEIVFNENLSTRAAIHSYERQFMLNPNEKFTKKDLEKLKVHEIETHVYRYINGLNQPYRIFVQGTRADWLATEEGLAALNEYIFDVSSNNALREYAGRVVAIKIASQKSFYETFTEMCNYFDIQTAYKLTKRAKRGMFDTSLPGCFTKDYFYLDGILQVSKYLYRGGSIKHLYLGKISVNDVDTVKHMKELVKPKYLPKYPAKAKIIAKTVKLFKKIGYENY